MCFFLALIHLSSCSEKTVSIFDISLCGWQLACWVCACPCVSALMNVSTAVWPLPQKTYSQAVYLWRPLIIASSDHFIASTQFCFTVNVSVHMQVGTHVCVHKGSDKWYILLNLRIYFEEKNKKLKIRQPFVTSVSGHCSARLNKEMFLI